MGLVPWQATVTNETKQVVPNPVVTVRNVSDDTLATLYSDAAGTSEVNPITGDADGFVQFWAQPGEYYIDGAKDGEVADRWYWDAIDVGVTQPYASRAAMIAADIPDAVTRVGCFIDPLTSVSPRSIWYMRAAGEEQFSDFPGWVHDGILSFEHFGAAGDYRTEAGASTDDTTAIQEALDYLGTNETAGGVITAHGRYRTTSPLVIDGQGGVTIEFMFPRRINSSVLSLYQKGVIFCDFTEGPGIWVKAGKVALLNGRTASSTARKAAAATTGVGNINCGILIEPEDTPSGTFQGVEVSDFLNEGHPGGGILVEGSVEHITLRNCYEVGCAHGHGKSFTRGDLSGRTNKKIPGIINIEQGKSFDCGGHALAIGHPDSGAEIPYRVNVNNHEGFRLASDGGARYDTSGDWIVGQNVLVESSAFGGTGGGNVPTNIGVVVGGRDVKLLSCRYISCVGSYVKVIQHSGASSFGIHVDGGIADTAGVTPPDYFASIAAGADSITIERIVHDCANPITDISVATTNSDITLHDMGENKTAYHNHTYDFSGADVRGIFAEDPIADISGGTITIDRPGIYRVRTEGLSATDDLVNIAGGVPGWEVGLHLENGSRTVTIVENVGNIRNDGSGSFAMDGATKYIWYVYTSSNLWIEKTRSAV